jgi:ornithine cyclodeaminase/alanine dehydrogenase-like protein (mu-crystallin family)
MAALAAADDPALLAVKMVVLNSRNSDRNLPKINGLVTLLNSDTGLPVAILDGNWIKDSFSVLDQITIDDLAQEAALPNKLVAPQHVSGDLSGLVLGKFSGRDQATDRNAFIFRGHALGDLALSALALQKSGISSTGPG